MYKSKKKSSKNTIKMEVPAEYADQLKSFMDSLKISSEGSPGVSEDTSGISEVGNRQEVKLITDHYIQKNNWYFEVQWRDGSKDWISDSDCNCEWLISKYLLEKNIKTTFIVCRVSSKKQASMESTSLETQEKELRNHIESPNSKHRIKVCTISSSAYKKIPQQLEIIGESANSEDHICVWRVDRLSRNIIKYMEWIEDLDSRGVEIISYADNINYSNNKLEFIQLIVNAQREAEMLSKRIKQSIKRKRDRGDQAVGCLPYGKKYKRILTMDRKGTLKKIVVDNPSEMKIINFILSCKYTRKHEKIAKQLNNENRLKRGKKWNRLMIARIRKNMK